MMNTNEYNNHGVQLNFMCSFIDKTLYVSFLAKNGPMCFKFAKCQTSFGNSTAIKSTDQLVAVSVVDPSRINHGGLLGNPEAKWCFLGWECRSK